MKRLLSLLVVIAMVVSMIPNVFAAKEDIDMDELLGRLVVLEDIEEINVILDVASDGMIYQWTPAENCNLSLSWTAPEGTDINVTVTQGEAVAVAENGAVSLDVWAEKLVEIEVSEAAGLAATFTIAGEDNAVEGSSEWTPITLTELEQTVTAAGTTFSGNTTWFAGYFGGTDLTITGEGAFNVIYQGETIPAVDGIVVIEGVVAMGRMPVAFAIDTVGEYTIKAEYPVGTQMNPEVLFRPAYIQVNIEAGNNQGYYYKWTSQDAGVLTLTCPTVEGVEYDVTMTNMTTFAQAWLVDSTDGTISLAVGAGDEVVIQVSVVPDANFNYPALETAITGVFSYPAGTQGNPEVLTSIESINVNIAEGNTQGYYYTWTATEDGTLVLNCPAADVEYDANMINMTTFAQAWLVDSTDGKISLDVVKGDVVNITVNVIPDASWNYPALQTTITGELVLPAPSVPEILQHPVDSSVKMGETASFTVEFSLPGAKYAWQYKAPTAENWSGSSASTTNTINVAASRIGLNGRQYRCVITYEGVKYTSEPGTLWIDEDRPSITKQPEDKTVMSGDKIVLSFEHDANEQAVAYQWEYRKSATGTWSETSMTGCKTGNLEIIGYISRNGYQYRCKITTPNGSENLNWRYTNPVTVTVLPVAVITEQPQSVSVAPNGAVEFHIEAQPVGQVLTYQWQYWTGSDWSNTTAEGNTTNTLKLTAAERLKNRQFRCVLKNEFADKYKSGTGFLFSDSVKLDIVAPVVVKTQPASVSAALNEYVTFTVEAECAIDFTYQWQFSDNQGKSWSNTTATGNTTDTITVKSTAKTDGRMYRCQFINVINGQKAFYYTDAATLTLAE